MHTHVIFLFHELQVFYLIVLPVVVNVMNNLIISQVPANVSFHQHSMKHYVSIPVCVRMLWNIHKHITTIVDFCVPITIQPVIVA